MDRSRQPFLYHAQHHTHTRMYGDSAVESIASMQPPISNSPAKSSPKPRSVAVQLSMIVYKTISRLFRNSIESTRLDLQFTGLNSDWGFEIGLKNSKRMCKKNVHRMAEGSEKEKAIKKEEKK